MWQALPAGDFWYFSSLKSTFYSGFAVITKDLCPYYKILVFVFIAKVQGRTTKDLFSSPALERLQFLVIHTTCHP